MRRDEPTGTAMARAAGKLKAWLRKRGLLAPVKRLLQVLMPSPDPKGGMVARLSYRFAQFVERASFTDVEAVHDLPPIFHYWSNTYLLPKLNTFGFSSMDDVFLQALRDAVTRAQATGRLARVISIGSGNCDFEVRLAAQLVAEGRRKFVIECMDLNDTMLARGATAAELVGVSPHIQPLRADFNDWRPGSTYDVIIANQSLHHVLQLESLFAAVHASLADEGVFIASDMIGRNGHLRWPEARQMVDAFWAELPTEKRYNHAYQRLDENFKEYDASVAGFEGIRAQDILPLLVERFQFSVFIGYANVIAPFLDRAYGLNFDPNDATDRAFIDRVQAADEAALIAGVLKPTQMLAVMGKREVMNPRFWPAAPRESCRVPG